MDSGAIPALGFPDALHNLPPFIQKLWEMLHTAELQPVITWGEDDTIRISDPEAFAAYVLPRYFKHGNLASFTRQLNWYGFSKMHTASGPTDAMIFKHPKFSYGHPELLPEIHRRLNVGGAEGRLNKSSKSRAEPRTKSTTAPLRKSTRSIVKHRDVEDMEDSLAEDGEDGVRRPDRVSSPVLSFPLREERRGEERGGEAGRGEERGGEEWPGEEGRGEEWGGLSTVGSGALISHDSRIEALQQQVSALTQQLHAQQSGLHWMKNQLALYASRESALYTNVEQLLYGFYTAMASAGFRIVTSTGSKGQKALKFVLQPPVAEAATVRNELDSLSFPEFHKLIAASSWWPNTSQELTRTGSFQSSKRARPDPEEASAFASLPMPLPIASPDVDSPSAYQSSNPATIFPPLFSSPSFPQEDDSGPSGTPAGLPDNNRFVPPLRRVHSLAAEYDAEPSGPPAPATVPFPLLLSPSEYFEVPLDIASPPSEHTVHITEPISGVKRRREGDTPPPDQK